jgi:predicted peptidase
MTYQKCSSDTEGAALADVIVAAIHLGLRIDKNRVYLSGFSKGGSGSYKLVRGFLSRGELFAGIVRVAGQTESVLPDEAIEKTSIWYHIGSKDTAARVQVAQDAYDYVKNHDANNSAEESTKTDTFTGFPRTTRTLTKNSIEIMKLSEYEGMDHTPGPVYTDPELFDWLFGQSLLCRE